MTRPTASLIDRTYYYIKKHKLLQEGEHVLAAVSGGPDSVALLDILSNLKDFFSLKITVVHLDHKLRGVESRVDSEFVNGLAEKYGLHFHGGTADVRDLARSKKVSIEMAARACRQSFFRKARKSLGATAIALGHTADDQAEEVLLRLLRGTGPAGMKAMLPHTQDGTIRPLLFAMRGEVIEYLLGRGISFREDATNLQPVCQRNALRLLVFPHIRKAFHSDVAKTIARFADLVREEETWWDLQVREAWASCGGKLSGQDEPRSAALDLASLRLIHPALLRRLLRNAIEKVRGNLAGIYAVHLTPLLDMVFSEFACSSILLPGEIEAVQRSGKIVIRMHIAEKVEWVPQRVEIRWPGTYKFGPNCFIVLIDEHTVFNAPDPDHAIMDFDKLRWPLRIRFWENGDRFRPLGMTGSRKLQDYFTDCKVPKEDRRKIPILCDGEKICWIAGFRMDERVRTGPETRKFVDVKMVKN